MVIRRLLRELSQYLPENGAFEAREIIMYALNMTLTEIAVDGGREVSASELCKIYRLAERRASGEPLQYITGTAGFMGMDFEVNSYTLIPRQDTETLVEAVINMAHEGARILDIGTGSGAIGISLARMVKNADVTLADISEGAINTAKRNADKNGVRVKTLLIDILSEIPRERYDIVVSNPPYIKTDVIAGLSATVRDYEPLGALDGGCDGLTFYRRITEIAPDILFEGGALAYEIGYDQGKDVSEMVQKKFRNVRILKDLCGNDRVITARLGKDFT